MNLDDSNRQATSPEHTCDQKQTRSGIMPNRGWNGSSSALTGRAKPIHPGGESYAAEGRGRTSGWTGGLSLRGASVVAVPCAFTVTSSTPVTECTTYACAVNTHNFICIRAVVTGGLCQGPQLTHSHRNDLDLADVRRTTCSSCNEELGGASYVAICAGNAVAVCDRFSQLQRWCAVFTHRGHTRMGGGHAFWRQIIASEQVASWQASTAVADWPGGFARETTRD